MCYTLYSQLFTIFIRCCSWYCLFLFTYWLASVCHQCGYFHLLRFLCAVSILQMEMKHLSRKATYLSMVVVEWICKVPLNRILNHFPCLWSKAFYFFFFFFHHFLFYIIILIGVLDVVIRPLCVRNAQYTFLFFKREQEMSRSK